MKILQRPSLVLFLIGIGLSSCYQEDLQQPQLGLEYFPMNTGAWSEFEVDSVWRDDPIGQLGSGETHYQLRELSESQFIDQEGRPSMRIERFRRENNLDDWTIKDVWSRSRTAITAEQNEENVIFIKFNFPVKTGKHWLGNDKTEVESVENWLGQSPIPNDWNYTYLNINEPYQVDELAFDSTVTVEQINRPAAFGINIFSQEVYAINVGLIHRQITVYDIQQKPDSPTLKDTVGFMFEQRITDFGQ